MFAKRCHLLCRFCRDDQASPLNLLLRVVAGLLLIVAALAMIGGVTYAIVLRYNSNDPQSCAVSGPIACIPVGCGILLATMFILGFVLGIPFAALYEMKSNYERLKEIGEFLLLILGGMTFFALLALQTYLLLPWINIANKNGLYCGQDDKFNEQCFGMGAVNLAIDLGIFLTILLCHILYFYCKTKIQEYNNQIDSLV